MTLDLDKLVETGLFETFPTMQSARLKNTRFYVFKDYKGGKPWRGFVHGGDDPSDIMSLEEVFNELPKEMVAQLIFHLDLFR